LKLSLLLWAYEDWLISKQYLDFWAGFDVCYWLLGKCPYYFVCICRHDALDNLSYFYCNFGIGRAEVFVQLLFFQHLSRMMLYRETSAIRYWTLSHKFEVYNYGKRMVQLTVYNHNGGPCYRCLFPTPPLRTACQSCADGGVLGVGMLSSLVITKNFSDRLIS
jgi:hypothetical protein